MPFLLSDGGCGTQTLCLIGLLSFGTANITRYYKRGTMKQTNIVLDCGHNITTPVGDVSELPRIGAQVRCTRCGSNKTIRSIGIPYEVQSGKKLDPLAEAMLKLLKR